MSGQVLVERGAGHKGHGLIRDTHGTRLTFDSRPFRVGVLGESIRTGAELTNRAGRAEGIGYSTLLLRAHLVRSRSAAPPALR